MPAPDRLHARSLLGLRNPDCVIPGCASCMESTGDLVHLDGPLAGWYVEFRCPDHGLQLTGWGRWLPWIEAALREEAPGPASETPYGDDQAPPAGPPVADDGLR